jgi:formylmethanofuran dehydrogenase subunit E
LTGCTLGKGNLILHDYGKHVYAFLRPSDGRAVRMVVRPDYWSGRSPEHQALSQKIGAGTATAQDRDRFLELQETRARQILELPEAQLLDIQPAEMQLPPRGRFADYRLCDRCGELVLVARVQEIDGQKLCRPCATKGVKE